MLKKGCPTEPTKGFSRPYPRLSGGTGDIRKILIIRPLFHETSCNSTICPEINYLQGFIIIKLLLGFKYNDKEQLYGR